MNKIRLGLSATLSGIYSLQGIDSLNGLLLWSEYQNSLGGISVKDLGKNLPVELVYFDDESNPEKTGVITRRLITEEKVDILLGPYSSSLSLASAEVADIHERVLWNYGGSTDEIFTNKYKKTVSSITPASRYFYPYLDFLIANGSIGQTIAVVYAENSGFSTQVAMGAINYSKLLGFNIKVLKYLSGSDNFAQIMDHIRKDQITNIMGVGRFEDDMRFATCLSGLNSCLVGAGIDQFKKELCKDCEGFCSISQWEPGVNLELDFGIDSSSFTELYSSRFGKVPDYTSAQSFNVGNILSHFIEKLGTIDENKLRKEIINSRFTTFYGEFAIDLNTNFQSGHKTVVTQWQNGKKEIIFPPGLSTSCYNPA